MIKEISITKYGNDKKQIPTISTYEIYQYSDAMLKHLPKDSLKKIQKTLLFGNTAAYDNKTTIDHITSKRHNRPKHKREVAKV